MGDDGRADYVSAKAGIIGLTAHTAAYLVSPDDGFVSGQLIYVAGGPVD